MKKKKKKLRVRCVKCSKVFKVKKEELGEKTINNFRDPHVAYGTAFSIVYYAVCPSCKTKNYFGQLELK